MTMPLLLAILAVPISFAAAWRRFRMWRISTNGASWTHLVAAVMWWIIGLAFIHIAVVSKGGPDPIVAPGVLRPSVLVLATLDYVGWRARARGRL